MSRPRDQGRLRKTRARYCITCRKVRYSEEDAIKAAARWGDDGSGARMQPYRCPVPDAVKWHIGHESV